MLLELLERVRLLMRPRRSCWINDLLLVREKHGFYNWLIPRLLKNERYNIRRFLRVSDSVLSMLIDEMRAVLTKHSNFRECVSPEEKVIIALRFYATGESYESLTWGFLRAPNTISLIVTEVSEAIYNIFQPMFLRPPQTVTKWIDIADEFERRWNFPNCLGERFVRPFNPQDLFESIFK